MVREAHSEAVTLSDSHKSETTKARLQFREKPRCEIPQRGEGVTVRLIEIDYRAGINVLYTDYHIKGTTVVRSLERERKREKNLR